MKKYLLLILATTLVLTLVSGCGAADFAANLLTPTEPEHLPETDPATGEIEYPPDPITDYDSVETVSGMLVKAKKYTYGSKNVEILWVENTTEENCTLTITGTYLDKNGRTLTTETKTFRGYAAGCQNYFVFEPGISYDSFSYTLSTKPYTKETYLQYFRSGRGEAQAHKIVIDNEERIGEYVGVSIRYPMMIAYTGEKSGEYTATFVFIDNNGEIYHIETSVQSWSNDGSREYGYLNKGLVYTDTLWDDRKNYVLPVELSGENAYGIVSIAEIKQG